MLLEREMGSLGIVNRRTNQTKVVFLVDLNSGNPILEPYSIPSLNNLQAPRRWSSAPQSSQSPIPLNLPNLVSTISLFLSSPKATIRVSPLSPVSSIIGVLTSGLIQLCLSAAAAAKSLQSCPTLWDPTDGSPPGSSVPGILQARILEWVAISFSNAWKRKVKMKSLSRARLSATPRTIAYQAPPPMGFSRQEYWSGLPLPSPQLCLQNANNDLPKAHQSFPWCKIFPWLPCCCCSVANSCPTLCNPMDSAHQVSPSFTISQSLLKLMFTESVKSSNHHALCHPPFSSSPQSFPPSRTLPVSQLFTSGGQSIGASVSVLLMNIQGWFPLGLTGFSSMQSEGLSRVFSSTTNSCQENDQTPYLSR